MGMKITVNVRKFKEQLNAKVAELEAATRPAAQAGAQIIYDRAKELAPVSMKPHWFYGRESTKAPKGKKKAFAYGPYQPGNLRDSIYQVFSKDNSHRDVSTYHISWNAMEAPYGGMVERGTSYSNGNIPKTWDYGQFVEFGNSRTPAQSFIGRAVKETRQQVLAAIKATYIEVLSKK